jgi:fumarate hydratase class II
MNLYKVAQDVRFLASGPRCGFGEINIPQNEPGSSIMPGKVNPTQCEGMSMICCQVLGHDNAISMLASQGNFELNTFGTVLMQNFIQSVTLFADMINSFNKNCVAGITINEGKMKKFCDDSLMLVTALKEVIGYHDAAVIANNAFKKGISLKESALELGSVSEEEYDKIMDPKKMVNS